MRWKNRPAGSNWGDFGPEDQLGRLNLLTKETVLKAAKEIQTGQTFCLSLPLDYPGGNVLNPRRSPPKLEPTQKDGLKYFNFPLGKLVPGACDVLSDDQVTISLQYSSQWDSFAHVGALFDADGDGFPERVYYNGFRPNIDILSPMEYDLHNGFVPSTTNHQQSNAKALDIANFAVHGIQGRGVLVDLAFHFGRASKSVTYDDLMYIFEKDGIEVESGDILLFHTEFAKFLLESNKELDPHLAHNTCCTLDGRDEKLLQWISDSGISAIVADNYAVETYDASKKLPSCCSVLPLHHHCLFKLGLPLGELWYLSDLAEWLRANNRNRFMLTAPPLRLPGAVGSPVTAIATV